MRSVVLSFLTLVPSLPPFAVSAEPTSTVSVMWSADTVSPAVCVEKGGWFVSVIPANIPLEGLVMARLLTDEGEQAGHLLHLDANDRLCLIESDQGHVRGRPVPLGECLTPKPGEKAECLSGSGACRSTVAGKDWSYRGEHFRLPLLRLRVSEAGSPCGAGTPLVSEEGHLIGILTDHALESSGELHAIPANRIRKLVEDVKRHHRSGPVWIGLLLHRESSTPEVVEVKPGSPAAEAGVKEGDVILSIGKGAIGSYDDLVEAILNLPAGETVEMKVLRGLDEHSLTITPRFAEVAEAR
ncbi:MAG: PDZ domain-containing protein [Verrucomicrobia bacterium]|nr:PDZ domain-containing protein [Verrucomicrobiota bacterium]